MTKKLERIDIVFENVEVYSIPIKFVKWFFVESNEKQSSYQDGYTDINKVCMAKELELVLYEGAKGLCSVNMSRNDMKLLERLQAWNDISYLVFTYSDESSLSYIVPYYGLARYYRNHLQKIVNIFGDIHISVGKRFVKMPILGYLKDVFKVKIVIPIKEYWRKITRWKTR